MKSKFLLLGFAFALLFTLGSCKSKESAYKAAYERAKQKEMQESGALGVVPAPSTNYSDATVQRERVVAIDGSSLKRYSVVIGSFVSKTNASSLKDRMRNQGYQSILVQNAQDMYRVIVYTFDDKASAASSRDELKRHYYPDFQDAWILEQEY